MPDLLSLVVRATSVPAEADVLLARVAAVLRGAGVEWVLADRLDEPDLVTRVAALGPDGPLTIPDELGPTAARRSSAASIGMLPTLLASAGHLMRLDADELRAVAASGEGRAAQQAAAVLGYGVGELVLAALVARGTPLGVLVLGFREHADAALMEQLPDVASHVAMALDAARLLTLQNAVARTMQESLLPPMPALPGLALAARYVPAVRGLDVGGDWYDAFGTGTDVVVAIGDVTGHDLEAAARMADLRNLLRAHAVEGVGLPPDAVLHRLARTASVLGLDATATVTMGRLLRRCDGGWTFTWCNAGHPPPVLLAGGAARLLEPSPDLMLGVEEDARRSSHVVELWPGDTVVLFTDGLVERRGVDLDDALEELRRTVEAHAGHPDALAEHLLTRLAATAPDDVALLVVRVEG